MEITRRARMGNSTSSPDLIEKKRPNNRKIEFELKNNRISALHFLRLNCIISV